MAALQNIINPDHLAAMGMRLLDWYMNHARDLPWRSTRDPYAIWVAEVMLQQTRAGLVVDRFRQFLHRFPTLQSLAAASLDDVLKAWEGLGYYSRARNLHAAARQVVQELDGRIPETPEALIRLPGVGPYIAAAIASIAFGHDVIALDGNLIRVLCRLLAIDEDPSRPRIQRFLRECALAMVPPGRAGDLNQAMMDLGATLCLPARPRCLVCPLFDGCLAQRQGIQNELPIIATRTRQAHRDVTAGVIWDGNGRFLITQRPADAMLGGLWEFPGGKRCPGEALPACLLREIREELGIEIEVGELLCTIEHSFTHFHMTLYAFQCRWLSGEPQCLGCAALRWVRLDELDAFAFPVADQKIISHLRALTGASE